MKSDSDTNSTLVLRDDLLVWLEEFIRSEGSSLTSNDQQLSRLLDVLDERLHMHLAVRSQSASLQEIHRGRVHCRFLIDAREKWLNSLEHLESEVAAGEINLGTKPTLSIHPLAAAAMEDAAERGIDLFISVIPEDHSALPIPEPDPPQAHQPEKFEYPDWFVAESADAPDELFEQLFSDALSSLQRRFGRDFDPLTGSEATQAAMTEILSGSPPHQLRNYVRSAARHAFTRHKRRERTMHRQAIENSDLTKENYVHWDSPPSDLPEGESLWTRLQKLLGQLGKIHAAMIVATEIDDLPPRECCQKVYHQFGTLPAGKSRPSDQRRPAVQAFAHLCDTYRPGTNTHEPNTH